MILVKFFLVVFGLYLATFLFFRLFGKRIMRYLMGKLAQRAQADMDRQSREYQQQAEGYSPYEERVFIKDDVQVSINRNRKGKSMKDQTLAPNRIEQVDYEDVEEDR